MNLSPVHRGAQPLRILRELARPGMLVWFAVGLVLVWLFEWWGLPAGTALVSSLIGLLAGGRALASAARNDRDRYARGELGLRPPRAADPRTAPPPSLATLVRRSRRARGALWAAMTISIGVLVVTPSLARAAGTGPFGLPNEIWWVCGPGFALWWAWLVRSELSRLALPRGIDVDTLPRAVVTVLGFSTELGEQVRLVVADGAVAVPPDPTTGAYDGVWAGRFGRRDWRDVVPGDVLVRDGRLVPGGVVALSDGAVSSWLTHLEQVDGPERPLRP